MGSSRSGYNSIHHGVHHSNKKKGVSSFSSSSTRDNTNDSDSALRPPHLYSTPVVSAPLITWYGLPTVIEFEQPAVVAAPEAEESGEEFTSIKGGGSRLLKHEFSRSAYSTTPPSTALQHRTTEQQQQKRRRPLSKSLFAAAPTDDDRCISAYTYRVRASSSSSSSMAKPNLDEHRLRLRQNLDGTYSHVASSSSSSSSSIGMGGTAITMPNGDFAIDDVPDSDTGLLMSEQSYNNNNHTKASISLDTVMNLEETLANMENKALPPHAHPSIPCEILQPQHTRTAPPLKLWPLAVLVFYSEFILVFIHYTPPLHIIIFCA
jgi:hypothetical protein